MIIFNTRRLQIRHNRFTVAAVVAGVLTGFFFMKFVSSDTHTSSEQEYYENYFDWSPLLWLIITIVTGLICWYCVHEAKLAERRLHAQQEIERRRAKVAR